MAKNKKGKKNNKQARNVMKPASTSDTPANPKDAVKVAVTDQAASGDTEQGVTVLKSPTTLNTAAQQPLGQLKEETADNCVKPPEVDSGRDSPESGSTEVEEDLPASSTVEVESRGSTSSIRVTPARDERKVVSAKSDTHEVSKEQKKPQTPQVRAEKGGNPPASQPYGGLPTKAALPSEAKYRPRAVVDDGRESTREKEPSVAASTSSVAADSSNSNLAKPKKRRVPQLGLSKYKHQLEFEWSFWYSDPWLPWEAALAHVQDFAYIEDFWSLFNNLKVPSEVKYSYYLFKKGIRPEWEDPVNESGGKWTLTHGKASPDQLWQELVLLFIGGAALDDLSSHVTGIYFAHKRTYGCQVSVWLDTTDRVIVKRIGDIIRSTLQTYLHCDIDMDFATHGKQIQGSKKKAFRQPNQVHSSGVATF